MASLEDKIDALTAQVSEIAERQRRRDELIDEMTPILKEVIAVGSGKLGDLEERGYFAFGRELLHVLDNVVEGYSAADVEELANSVVGILDTLRQVTQPHVMQVAAEAGEVMENPEQIEPVGMLGMMKASRDDDVQRGMAMMLEVLRRVGAGAAKISKRQKLQKMLGPRRRSERSAGRSQAAPPVRRQPQPQAAPPCEAEVAMPTPVEVVHIAGVELSSEGFLADSQQWTPEIAKQVAAGLGVSELTPTHWQLIEAARADYAEHGASPNIRRLTKVSGLSTKQIYQLFPKAPGKCTAKVAGLPKPVGCI